MSIRFAPAASSAHNLSSLILSPTRARRAGRNAANENHAKACDAAFDPVLVDALRHFARHGIRSAQAAGDEALSAKLRSDIAAHDYWLEITASFDPRLAKHTKSLVMQQID